MQGDNTPSLGRRPTRYLARRRYADIGRVAGPGDPVPVGSDTDRATMAARGEHTVALRGA
ncbi:MAG: hypothetical protein H0V67_07635 [Geodermatophilaceae bacterium]|nr:hypothetical protein [Geodermatophilaceae bacterium]